MTELVLKSKMDRQKSDSIIIFLKSWGIDVEIKPLSVLVRGKHIFQRNFGQSALYFCY